MVSLTRLAVVLYFALPASACAAEAVTITTRDGRAIAFSVEVARTPEKQAQGLMHRTEVPEGTGMLFLYQPPQEVSFWMKNTLVPLDMIFIGEDNRIVRIAENTVPLSLEGVSSGEPVIAVLEIAGGTAARLGIAEGGRVRW